MHLLKLTPIALLFAPLVLGSFPLAATGPTKDEAVAMVKKAVGTIKNEGPDKAYAEIDDPKGPFVNRDLYISQWLIWRTSCLRMAQTRRASAPTN